MLRFGQSWAVVGEHWLLAVASGSGKTTALHILAALTTLSMGTAIASGTDLGGLSSAPRDRCRWARV